MWAVQWLGQKLDDPQLESWQGQEISLFSNIVQTGCRANPAPYSTSSVVFSQAWSGLGVQLTTHLRPVPGLRMSAAIPLFPYVPSLHRQGNFTFTDESKFHAYND